MEKGQKCSFPGCGKEATCICDNCGKTYCGEHCTHNPDNHIEGMICLDCQEKEKTQSEDQGEQPDGQ
jgi:hypothetical protein